MINRQINILNGIIFSVLLLINVLVFVNRDNGFAYKEYASYQELYSPKELIHITGFTLYNDDSLEIKLTYNNNLHTNNTTIKLIEGKHLYSLPSVDLTQVKRIELGINFTKSTTYKSNGRTRNSTAELYYCNIPSVNYNQHSINDWQYADVYSTSKEIEYAKQILKDSIHIKPTENSITKLTKIAQYILQKIDKERGTPDDSAEFKNAIHRFNNASNHLSKVWCGDFANIFSFFLFCENIPSRLVCLEGKIGAIDRAGHSFNEVYVKELNKWVFMDLTSKTLFVHSISQRYLNTIDFYQLHSLSPHSLIATTIVNDSITEKNYISKDSLENENSIKDFYNYYFTTNNCFVFYFNSQFDNKTYSTLSKLKRYISKSPTFATYCEAQEVGNEKFYLKQFAFCMLILFSVYCILCFMMIKKTKA